MLRFVARASASWQAKAERSEAPHMPIDLQSALPHLLPRAIQWAEAEADNVVANGVPLIEAAVLVASRMGVQQPRRVRVLLVKQLPLPADPELQAAAIQTGFLGPNMVGLTLGYSILICDGHMSWRLLSHECRHVFQYEHEGSIAAFLPKYLRSIVEFGYVDSPYEQDARAHELSNV